MEKRLIRMRSFAASRKSLKKMRSFTRVERAEWKWFRHIDRITPYGKWAIPPYIVSCESHFLWSAYNPSGASGPYQLLGKGAPMPANNTWAQARHHEIAHALWAGGAGAHHWVCA